MLAVYIIGTMQSTELLVVVVVVVVMVIVVVVGTETVHYKIMP